MNIEMLRCIALSHAPPRSPGCSRFWPSGASAASSRAHPAAAQGPARRKPPGLAHLQRHRYVPMSGEVADATRDMLSRSGVTMPAASFWAIRVASFSAGVASV